MTRRAARRLAALTFAHAAIAGPIAAQAAPVADSSRGFVARHPALVIGASGGTAALILWPFDRTLLHEMRSPAPQESAFLQSSADLFNLLGGVGFVGASVTMLGAGYATRSPSLTQVGVRTSEAIVANALINGFFKGAFGRRRPFVNEQTPNVFGVGKGFNTPGRTSFPSGHTSSSFAFATAATVVLRQRSPRVARVAGPALFTAATLVAGARVYGARHWPSDVVAGATVGTLSGWLVTRHDVEVSATSVRWRF